MSGCERAFAAALILALPGSLALAARRPVAQPALITVPQKLRALTTTIEPSGVVWAAPIQRYLVVSDDTDSATARHHPWVLAMTRDGALDDEPVPIRGIDAINDAESICAGPGGTFFIATSHSPNKKGHTKPERRMLLQLKLAGRALEVIGRADLTTARGPGGETLLAIAGLPLDGRLDIEAITFTEGESGGALLIGLKSPLTSSGNAVILRLADPATQLAAGTLTKGALTRDRELSLHVLEAGATIAQGIADLTRLPDGSLLIAANSPKGMPHDGGGAIYRVAGRGAPVLVRRFAGHKPEGVTLSDDGKSVVVVFDCDTLPPLWLRLPLPHGGPA